jgi:4-aminobutyrate aminotransferase
MGVIRDEHLLQRANALGQRLRDFLKRAQTSNPSIAEVRGLGSMNAVEFIDPQAGQPSARIAQAVQRSALAKGLLLLTCGVHGNVIRFLYPLTIPDAQFDQALTVLGQALAEAIDATASA